MTRMLPDGRRLGAHLPVGDGLVRAADRAAAIGANALQIFGDNPTAWTRRAGPPAEQDAFRARLAQHDISPLVVHASYLVNLAGPDPDFFERSVGLLAAELHDAPGLGASHVNVHVGSHRGSGVEAGTERLADGIVRALALAAEAGAERPFGDEGPPPAPVAILLENSSGGGWGLGANVPELAGIAEAIDRRGVPPDRVGFCLDTAHAWGAGYDLSDPVATDALLEEFGRRIGFDRLRLIHLNDSKSSLGSRTDRHEHVGAGQIGEVGMAHLLRHPLLAHVTYILETPGMDEGYDAINIARTAALARGEPLDPLPPGALTLRGSRSRSAAAAAPDGSSEPTELEGQIARTASPVAK
jgi:deoxyribonuclease IV